MGYEFMGRWNAFESATWQTSIWNLDKVQKFKEKQGFQKNFLVVIQTDFYMDWSLMKEHRGKPIENDLASNFIWEFFKVILK